MFDWGGTLTPFTQVDLADLWSAAARVLAPERAAQLTAALLEVEREFWGRVERDGGRTSATLADIMATATRRTGLKVEAALQQRALTAHLEAWTPHTITEPEAPAVLRALGERGLRVGLLSNTHWPREWHERFLARDGVLDLIQARVYTSELRHTKPHAEAFRAVLEPLGVAASDAVMVGDRPVDDIGGARALGMRTVLRPNGQVPAAPVVPDATIGNLAELLEVIDAWR